ncbi:hypothetical protein J8273_2273 [Carpediemonas membranifera]|uniref:Transmembrane protein n=1 Tax=Carpediemonas membranifera TaxID=201153 RepID=A0A8J6B9E6_9EUKA|nr:hypothetical protein J8273_2273 [Carpediemonas membranifera]|eukprot:KAG9395924.1 hypothetical protein J8273_2273 [Carpediemonas membranifera]
MALETLPTPSAAVTQSNGFANLTLSMEKAYENRSIILYTISPTENTICELSTMNHYLEPVLVPTSVTVAYCATGHPVHYTASPITNISVAVTSIPAPTAPVVCLSASPTWCADHKAQHVSIDTLATIPSGALAFLETATPSEFFEYRWDSGPWTLFQPGSGLSLERSGTLHVRRVKTIDDSYVASDPVSSTVTVQAVSTSTAVTVSAMEYNQTTYDAETLRGIVPLDVTTFTVAKGALSLTCTDCGMRAHAHPLRRPGAQPESPAALAAAAVATGHDPAFYLGAGADVVAELGWGATLTVASPSTVQLVAIDIVPTTADLSRPTTVFVLQYPLTATTTSVGSLSSAVVASVESSPIGFTKALWNDVVGSGVTSTRKLVECLAAGSGTVRQCNRYAVDGFTPPILFIGIALIAVLSVSACGIGVVSLVTARLSLGRALKKAAIIISPGDDKKDL